MQRPHRGLRSVLLLLFGLGLGAAAGVVWWLLVQLPSYRVNSDGGAATTERGLAELIGGDAWFCALGLVAGIVFGVVAWRTCADLGWPLVALVLLAAVGGALVCWLVGYRLGPGDFPPRLAAAQAGQVVPVELTLRAPVSLITWPFFAIVPVLLGSSLGADEEEPRPLLSGRSARRPGSRSEPSGPR